MRHIDNPTPFQAKVQGDLAQANLLLDLRHLLKDVRDELARVVDRRRESRGRHLRRLAVCMGSDQPHRKYLLNHVSAKLATAERLLHRVDMALDAMHKEGQ